MVRGKRVERPKDDLKRELREQLQLLRMACESYDRGIEAAAKYIAVSLRVLLHHHGQSRALLEQLGYRTGRYLSSFPPVKPGNLLSDSPMLVMEMGEKARWIPLVQAGDLPFGMRPVPFAEWWAEIILRDQTGRTLTRMALVSNVANTDGGAHVDPELEEAYMAISRQNALGWVFGPEELPIEGRPELACMRQIAHEVLSTIHKQVPEFSDASEPVIPEPRSSGGVLTTGTSYRQGS